MKKIFSQQELESSARLYSRQMQSCYFENLGNFAFKVHPLPAPAQTGPVYGILSGDYNHDSYPDLLLSGNSYATEVINGPHDAFNGLLLLGNGKGVFNPQHSRFSGFWVTGDAKSLVQLRSSDGTLLVLAAQNNGQLLAFRTEEENIHSFAPSGAKTTALLKFTDGRRQKVETYQGSGYLSQSSTDIWLAEEDVEIEASKP